MKIVFIVLGLIVTLQTFASNSAELPILPNNLKCIDRDSQAMPYMNDEVMEWKTSTPDQSNFRAIVHGTITKIYPSKTGHTHFAIDIDSKAGGDIEVIYNDVFGALPPLKNGMKVSACGDYITVGPRARMPSPMGAILHWVHYNPGDRDGGKHKDGFLIIENRPYGFTNPGPDANFN